MNQEKIGNLIKELRIKSNLTQAEFAQKYNVSFQAVSKWETGKSIPDIFLLKQICKDYNISIENILDGEINKKNKKIVVVTCIIIIILLMLIIYLVMNKNNNFEFKTISTSCSNFNIYGSIAYNNNKSHLHLSNINYCGGEDNNYYVKIECTLYEQKSDVIKVLERFDYNDSSIKLEDFLKDIQFDLDDFSTNCKKYDNNTLYLEINATLENGQTTNYKVPLSLKDSCSK